MDTTLKNSTRKDFCLLKAFIYGLLFSALFFIPFLIFDNGYFLYYGDFNVQQIPFYQMIHDAIKSGNWKWSSTTDLGASVIGSYSFYNLGSPFFWVTMLFDSKTVPYLMGPLFILKFACASFSGCLYMKRYVKNTNFAVIGGLAYAFSGFSIYNIFFNHFHEAIIVFPLLLAAIDSFMLDKRKGVVALAVFSACIVNYYFFVGQVVFVIIYWIIMLITKTYKFKIKQFLLLAFEVIIGFLGTAILILPSVIYISQNPRVNAFPNGWDAVLYDTSQRYLHIIQSFFFPSDIPAFPNFTPESNAKWASVGGWLPLFGMTGVIAFFQTRHKSFLKKLIPLLILMAMIPFLNSAFQMFNSNIYYARWFYMITLMMSLATVFALENSVTDWNRAIKLSTGITVFIACIIGFMVTKTADINDEPTYSFGLETYPDIFWIYVSIALVSILTFAVIIKKYRRTRIILYRFCVLFLGLITVFYSMYTIFLGKTHGYDSHEFIIPYALNNGEDVDIDDIKQVRSDFYECMDNLGMFWQIPNIQAFQSCVPASIMEFYPSVGINRDVASRPDTSYFGLRSYLSCKYLFDYTGDNNNFLDEERNTKMIGWKYIDTQNGCAVYENEYYIPMGYMFDKFICTEEFEKIPESYRHLAVLKAMVLSQDQMEKYRSITGYTIGMYDLLNSENESDKILYNSIADDFEYYYEDYYNDCNKLKATACTEFNYTPDGFKAKLKNTGDQNLLFFSIPYDTGWKAYINGRETSVEKVNNGFMAIKVKKHTDNNIEFKYYPTGLREGKIISFVCALAFIFYITVIIIVKTYKKRKINSLANGKTEDVFEKAEVLENEINLGESPEKLNQDQINGLKELSEINEENQSNKKLDNESQ